MSSSDLIAFLSDEYDIEAIVSDTSGGGSDENPDLEEYPEEWDENIEDEEDYPSEWDEDIEEPEEPDTELDTPTDPDTFPEQSPDDDNFHFFD